MPTLKNKTILILSPQSWGKMFFSKHHYAIELAKRDNTVYFLNPPVKTREGEAVTIGSSGLHKNLFIIEHHLNFPYRLKFHFIWLFHWFMRFHLRAILKLIPHSIDIVWSFDLGNLYPFSFFPAASLKVFHPVDEPLNKPAIASARGAQVIFSVTNEILDKYDHFHVPKHFINHGLADDFLQTAAQRSTNGKIFVGFSGNLLRTDIDRGTFLQIIRENPDVLFECWGSYQLENTNIRSSSDDETSVFINFLLQCKNVVLHGPVSPVVLAKEFHRMDAFLICYDIKKDQSKGTNYHKVMEYVSTGKITISNNITTYKNQPALIQMTDEREHNNNLPQLFKMVVTDLPRYNSAEFQQRRIAFASDNTYAKQINRIEKIMLRQ